MPAANLSKDVVDTITIATKGRLSPGARILTAGDEAFHAVPQWSEWDRLVPAAILQPATEADLQTFVSTLISESIAFKAHSGGHSTFSTIESPGVIVDTGLLRKITVDAASGTATVEAGCTIMEVANEVFKHGFATTLGTCDMVGVSGLLLGGGIGAAQGLYGLFTDQVLAARVVTGSSGQLITTSARENPDLFFALRGAGVMGFGVVASFTLQLHPISTLGDPEGKVWQIRATFNTDDAEKVINKAVAFNDRENDKIASTIFLACMPPDFKPGVHFVAQCFGDEALRDKVLEELFAVAKPVRHEASHVLWPLLNERGRPFCDQGGYKVARGSGASHIRDAAALMKNYLTFLKESPASARSVILIDNHPRKALIAKGEDFNAYPHRSIATNVNAIAWYPTTAEEARSLQWLRSVRDDVLESSAQADVYVNFRLGDETVEQLFTSSSWSEEKKRERLDKLRAIKAVYDPTEVYGKNIF